MRDQTKMGFEPSSDSVPFGSSLILHGFALHSDQNGSPLTIIEWRVQAEKKDSIWCCIGTETGAGHYRMGADKEEHS